MNALLAIFVVTVVVIIMRLAIGAIMEKLAIRPADESIRSEGLRDVLERIRDRKRDD